MRKKKITKYLAGLLSMVMILTGTVGNVTMAAGEAVGENPAAASDVESTKNTEAVAASEQKTTEEVADSSEAVKEDAEASQAADKAAEQPQQIEETKEATEEPQAQAYEQTYKNDEVEIKVSAEAGIVPENAVLSVTPIIKREVTDSMSADEKAEAKKVNAMYEQTQTQLDKDSSKEEQRVEAFLAYDISFLVDGTEVEPTGDVNVSMKFIDPTAPEAISESVAVEMKHLKENAEAEDGIEVEAVETNMTVTDEKVVKEAEFASDSFSTFAITWNNSEDKITVHYVNKKGNEITGQGVQTSDIKMSGKIYIKDFAADIAGYTFNDAYILSPKQNSGSWGETVKTIQFSSRQLYYGKDDWANLKWERAYGYHVYLVYDSEGKTPPLLNTIDSSKDNIELNLFDYSTGTTESVKGSSNSGINNGKGLKFHSSADSNTLTQNRYTGGKSQRTGIVQDSLENGFPKLAFANQDSLKYLFDPQTTDTNRADYTGMNNLFVKDNDGYYVFDSEKSYAVADKTNNKFDVYNGIPVGGNGFYPFDSFAYANETTWGTSSAGACLSENNGNHYFGMTMSAGFYQPKDGKINGRDMVFEFTGDDDVWVFIDGTLVLDMGGIHDKIGGSINFATGEVKVNGAKQTSMFSRLGVDSLEDYSSHTIDFFYLERGNLASNCKLKFNLPTIPKDSVMVTKEVVDKNQEPVNYAKDIDFQFTISKNDAILANQPYLIYQNALQVGTGTTDAEGKFVLKHGQSAIFSDLKVTDEYEVTELGMLLDGYDVFLDKTEIEVKNSDGSVENPILSASSGTLVVGKSDHITFKNQVDKTAKLSITKKLENAKAEDQDKEFSIRLMIGNELYNGTYNIVGGTSGVSVKDGIIKLKADQTATITGLPYGVKIVADEVGLDGTYIPSYAMTGEAENVTANSDSVSGTMLGDSKVTVTNKMVTIETGKTSVSVTKNWTDSDKYESLIPASIEVTLYKDINRNGVKDDEDVILPGKNATQTLSAKNNWSYKWNGLEPDTDYVIEEKVPDGFVNTDVKYTNTLEVKKYLERVTNCDKLIYSIGKNNLLLVKKGSDFIIWTPYDLKLSADNLADLKTAIEAKGLPGANNIGTLEYEFGAGEGSGMTLTENEKNWTLNFAEKAVWSQFYTFQYDREEAIEVTNNIDENYKTSIDVNKQWVGDNEATRPESIVVQLYEGKTAVDGQTATITKDGNWKYTFTDLPYYTKDASGNYIKCAYTVKEIKIGGDVVVNGSAAGYTVGKTTTTGNVITIRNEQLKGSLKITKTIDKVNLIDGDPVFTFQITDVNGNVLIRTIRFSKEDVLTKSVTIEDMPLGVCQVMELKTMRYTCTGDTTQTVTITSSNVAEVKFSNELTYEENFSHTDVVENDFTIAADGTVTCEKNLLRGNTPSGGNHKKATNPLDTRLPEAVLSGVPKIDFMTEEAE